MTDTLAYRTFDVDVRGGRLRVGEWSRGHEEGPGESALVLAVHGVTSSHLAWPFVARALLARTADDGGPASARTAPERVVAPDLRGRARSSSLPGPYGMAQHADDLAAVLRSAGASADRPAVVVGHSMGAFASLVLADRHAELVDRLVLVDGGFPLEAPPGMTRDEALEALLGPTLERLTREFASPEAYLEYWRGHPAFAHAWSREVEDYVRYDLDGEAPHLHPSTVPAAIPDGNEDLYGGAVLLSALERLRVPAVFLRAERGFFDDPARLYPDEAMARWRAAYPAIEVREVPGTNHYTIVMTPDGAAAVARATLGGRGVRTEEAVRVAEGDTPKG
ncbi:alpha/beta fold hydrolase [Sinomonas flava]|uniref:alpha/beta fold hydrolase n=1 Tax=Sinomonas flava TaxID=496857 RepID=UPI0039A707E0